MYAWSKATDDQRAEFRAAFSREVPDPYSTVPFPGALARSRRHEMGWCEAHGGTPYEDAETHAETAYNWAALDGWTHAEMCADPIGAFRVFRDNS